MKVYDIFFRYSYDNDNDVVINVIFVMGLVGVGINNVRLV